MKLETLIKQTKSRDAPLQVQQSGSFVIFVDISQTYPSVDHKFDGNDWSLIHKTKQVATPNFSITVTCPVTGWIPPVLEPNGPTPPVLKPIAPLALGLKPNCQYVF